MPAARAFKDIPTNVWVARTCAVTVLVGGLLSALGWALNVPQLIDWLGSGVTIKFNAAVGLVITSTGLLLSTFYPRFRPVVRGLGGLALTIAVLTVLQTILGVDLGIDTLFFTEPPGALATYAPGRMGVPASMSFILLGSALISSTFQNSRRAATMLGLICLFIAAPSIAGYGFDADQLYMFPRLTGIALQTAVMLAALAVGVMAAIPEYGIAAATMRKDAGGLLLRRTLPLLLVIVTAMSWLLLQARLRDYFDSQFNAAIRSVLEMAFLMGVLWWTADRVSEKQRLSTETEVARREIETQRRIVEAQETERTRLSRDLHDQVGQEVTGLRLALVKLLAESKGPPELIAEINAVRKKIEKLDAEVSNLAWRMRPAVLDTDGIMAGIRRLGDECSAIHAIAFDLQASRDLPAMPADVETNIYRIIQESMNNVVKHAKATCIGVTLEFINGEIRLAVEDDGEGFDGGESSIHDTETGRLGLIGMRERAAIVGGSLDIESTPGSGTTILVRIPLKAA